MGIAALPANAVRTIGSTQCLTDPASLVKELIDNSLDARASSIHIEMTSDTVERLRVRDNGHGIAPADRGFVCKRHCTSKIRSIEDLHDLGGQSLGFRGEALASARELSSKIVVTTRIEGEATAAELGFGRSGLLETEKRVSHPVGTTIQIDHFLSEFPVRKQLAEKNSPKCLTRIKTLLQGYAFARPGIRISFKGLKAKGTRGDWSYGPRAGLTNKDASETLLLDAAVKLFGSKAAQNLLFQTQRWSSNSTISENASSKISNSNLVLEDEYSCKCLILDPKCIQDSSGGYGQYISIDNRPVSCDRGLPKHISSHYRSCVRLAAERLKISYIREPLLVMNLNCPKGSYDVNVDPAKDDVLFFDAALVIQKVKSIFEDVYGEQRLYQKEDSTGRVTKSDDQLEILLAEKRVLKDLSATRCPPFQVDIAVQARNSTAHLSRSAQAVSHGTFTAESERSSPKSVGDEDEISFLAAREAKWKSSMSAVDDELFELDHSSLTRPQGETGKEEESDNIQEIRVSNPWTFAKLNRPFRTPLKRNQNEREHTFRNYLPTPQQQKGDISDAPEQSLRASAHFFPYPQRSFDKSPGDHEGSSLKSVAGYSKRGALDSWLRKANISGFTDSNERETDWKFQDINNPALTRELAVNLPQRGTMLDVPDASQRAKATKASRTQQAESTVKPSMSLANDAERVWLNIGETSKSRDYQQKGLNRILNGSSISLRATNDSTAQLPKTLPNTTCPDLAVALDYEVRKSKAAQDHRVRLRREAAAEIAKQQAEDARQRTLDSLLGPGATHPTPNSPHQNRQARALAVLRSEAALAAGDSTEPSHLETRSHLDKKKPKNKTLPLESVRKEYWVSDLNFRLKTSLTSIERHVQKIVAWDEFTSQAKFVQGLDHVELNVLSEWETRLQQLMRSQYRREDPRVEESVGVDERNVTIDFSGLMEPAFDNA